MISSGRSHSSTTATSTAHHIFHCFIGYVYLFAFYSIYEQYPGLNSSNGLLPSESWLRSSDSQIRRTGQFGSLAVYSSECFLTVDAINETIMLVGICCSCLICIGYHHTAMFSLGWVCYSSSRVVGQTFTSFQWDILLLEVGFLCIFSSSALSFVTHKNRVVKLQAHCPTWEQLSALEYHFATQCIPTPMAWLAHQLPPILQRISVAATILIEIPLALLLVFPTVTIRRYACILQWILQGAILLTGNYNFFNLLTITLMIKVWEDDEVEMVENETNQSERRSKAIAASLTVPVNHGSHDTVTAVVSSVDENGVFLGYIAGLHTLDTSRGGILAQKIIFCAAILASIFWWLDFPISRQCMAIFDSTNSASARGLEWWRGEHINLRIKWAHLEPWLQPTCQAVVYTVVFHVFSQCMLRIWCVCRRDGDSRLWYAVATPGRVISEVVGGSIAIFWVLQSAEHFNSICNVRAFIPTFVSEFSDRWRSFSISSGYGLFRRMTGVGKLSSSDLRWLQDTKHSTYVPSIVARPEVVLEGLDGDDGQWKEVHFKYKPGASSQSPPIIAPMQPRLDWQMWFAALGSYQHNPWLIHLVYKLLHLQYPTSNKKTKKKKEKTKKDESISNGDTVEANAGPLSAVLDLLDRKKYPFKTRAPIQIRATLYDYDFTRLQTPWNELTPGAKLVPWSWPQLPAAAGSWGQVGEVVGVAWSNTVSAISSTVSTYVFNGSVGHSVRHKGAQKNATKNIHSQKVVREWWVRTNPREYLPPIEKENPSLQHFIESSGFPTRYRDLTPDTQYQTCLQLFSGLRKEEFLGRLRKDPVIQLLPVNIDSITSSVHRTICASTLLRKAEYSKIHLFDNTINMPVVAIMCFVVIVIGSLLNLRGKSASQTAERPK